MEATSSSSVVTEQSSGETSANISLALRNPHTETENANSKKVKFTEGTVDNEHLNRKKSKCCCIYEKQKLFGESSSEDEGDDEECPDHCHGRKGYHKKAHSNDTHDHKTEGHQHPQ